MVSFPFSLPVCSFRCVLKSTHESLGLGIFFPEQSDLDRGIGFGDLLVAMGPCKAEIRINPRSPSKSQELEAMTRATNFHRGITTSDNCRCLAS